jgi:fatty acid desaturase
MAPRDKARLIDLHQPRWAGFWMWLGFAAGFFLLEGVLAWSLLEGTIWLSVALVLVLAQIMHTHLIAFHEAAHGSLCPKRRLNDALGVFIGSLSFMGFSLYRAVHHYHHAYLASERDEELWPFVHTDMPRWFRCLAAATELIFGLAFTPLLFLRSFLRRGTPLRDRRVRRRIWAGLALITVVWTGVIAATAWFGAWRFLVVMYLAPALLAGFLQSLRKYIEHMGLTGATVLESTRSIISSSPMGRLVAFLLFNEPYHGVHHKYARLPQRALPDFADLLVPAEPGEMPPFTSYRSACWDMLGCLCDPRVGAQWRAVTDQPLADPHTWASSTRTFTAMAISSRHVHSRGE